MITNITLGNFKCFRHVSINPKLVTVLIGPNGTGKSGVLQALMLLKQSRDDVRSLKLQGDLVWFPPEAFVFQSPDRVPHEVELALSGYWLVESRDVESQIDFTVELRYSRDARLQGRQGTSTFKVFGVNWDIPVSPVDTQWRVNTAVGALAYVSGHGINDFELRDVGPLVPEYPDLWEQVSGAPRDAVGSMKVVPTARALARGFYLLGSEPSEDISSADGLGRQEEETATTLAYSRNDVEKVSRLM